jgi:thioesterase domain-containing protein
VDEQQNKSGQEVPSAAMLPELARICGEVLGHHVALEENFFEAGGTTDLAIRVCEQIRVELDQVVWPLMLYSAPTLVELSRALSDGKPVPFPKAILLKRGSQTAPVFLLHGLGGNVSELCALVRYVNSSHTIYGLQARGTDGLERPLERIEAMAEYHVEAIRQLQPHGPYLLCGYSLGGLIALEMARQFIRSGETVALLSMIDSYPHPTSLAPLERLRLRVQQTLRRAHRVMSTSESGLSDAEQSQAASEQVCGPAIRGVAKAAIRAWESYRPSPYAGKVRFLAAGVATTFPNPALAWKGLIDELAIETVPGNHHELLQANASLLAAALSRYLAKDPTDRHVGSTPIPGTRAGG